MADALKEIPTFENEAEEREFWATHDSTEYLAWDEAEEAVFPNLKPSSKLISLRLPAVLLQELRLLAQKQNVPYQSLIEVFLQERIEQELKK